eukprot:c23890_g3_i1 orf=46-1020(+)
MESTESSAAMQHNENIVFQSVKLPVSLLQDNTLPSPCTKPASPLLHTIKAPTFSFKQERRLPPKPLLDIEDVRAFIRSKLGPPKHDPDHSSAKRVHYGVFGIGTMGSSGSDGGYVHLSSPQANEHQGQISSHPSTHTPDQHHRGYPQDGYVPDHAQSASLQHDRPGHSHLHHHDHAQDGCAKHDHGNHNGDCCHLCDNGHPPHSPHHQHSHPPSPLLDIDDVRDAINNFFHHTGLRRRPTTSWVNKMPWHVPRAPFLAKGLEWPPDSFESEEARKEYYRKARKRKPYLLGAPPLWTVTAFNLAFLQLLMYNPVRRFFNFLKKLP